MSKFDDWSGGFSCLLVCLFVCWGCGLVFAPLQIPPNPFIPFKWYKHFKLFKLFKPFKWVTIFSEEVLVRAQLPARLSCENICNLASAGIFFYSKVNNLFFDISSCYLNQFWKPHLEEISANFVFLRRAMWKQNTKDFESYIHRNWKILHFLSDNTI